MIKIGEYELDARVYISSDNKSYNFATYYDEIGPIRNAFATAASVEFDLGPQTIILYSPVLQIMQINGNTLTVIFTAAEIPENKTKALEKRARELEAQLDVISEAIGGIEKMAIKNNLITIDEVPEKWQAAIKAEEK